MQRISSAKWTEWKKRRRSSFVGFIILGTIIGIDYSFMFSTLYLYLKDLIKADKPALYYGVIMATFNISSSIFGVICGRWVDKYRKIKVYTNIILIIQIIGGILYVIPSSVVYPLVGRLICGIGDPYISVITGEIIRIYDHEEGTSALWSMRATCSFGLMIGPALVIFFKNVDFYIVGLHFTQLNAVGILIVGMLVVVFIIVQFLIHDCSAMIDLKEYLKENITLIKINSTVKPFNGEISDESDSNSDLVEDMRLLGSASNKAVNGHLKETVSLDENEKNSLIFDENSVNQSRADERNTFLPKSSWKTEPIRVILSGLLKDVDAMLMFISTFVFAYSLLSSEVILPLINALVLDWSLMTLSIIYITSGILYIIVMILSTKFCVTDRSVFYMFMITIPCIILMYLDVVFINNLKRYLVQDVILMAVFVLFGTGGWVVEDVLVSCTLAKMVPSNCQSFTEALRNGLSRVSMVLASLTAPLAMPYLTWWCTAVIIINFALFVVFIGRRKRLLLVREIEFRHNCSI